MSEIKFTETEVPEVKRPGRERKPNPYAPVAERLSQDIRTDDHAGVALTLDVPKHDKGDDAAVAYAIRKIREAAENYNFTVRSTNEGRRLTVWGVPKITRERAKSE